MSSRDQPFETVRLEDALVSMATVEQLRKEADRLQHEAEGLKAAGSRSRSDAVARLVEAGLVLVARTRDWSPAHPTASNQLADVSRMIETIEELGGGIDRDGGKKRSGLSGLFGAGRAPVEDPQTRQAREELGSQLRVMLAELGRAYGQVLPAVAIAHEKAMAMETQSAGDSAAAAALEAEARDLRHQADTRARAAAEMGFDALHLAAMLRLEPAAEVDSPLALHSGERAYLVAPAELAREKAPAVLPRDLPITNFRAYTTGIPYRIGIRREGRLKLDALSPLGPGTFVVTNQRLGFVGKLKSFAFPLETLVHAEQHGDGLSLVRAGRDHADVVLTPSASRILFYVNYVLQLAQA